MSDHPLTSFPLDQDPNLMGLQLELGALEQILSDRELELATLQAYLQAFQQEYEAMIGLRRQILHQIEAQIRTYTRYLEKQLQFKPSPRLKQLYRDVAKRIHPDLALDESERLQRQNLMVEANQAYAAGDEAKLEAILADWDQQQGSGPGIASATLVMSRKISQIRARLQSIHQEIAQLESSDQYKLFQRVAQSRQNGGDLLREMAELMDAEIQLAQQQLQQIKAQLW